MPGDSKQHDVGSSGGRISPISLQKHLKGTNYPASKEDLVQRARSNHAPDDVLQMLGALPQNRFASPADVMRAFGQKR
jgi:Protein of unknown function (DUF2795)